MRFVWEPSHDADKAWNSLEFIAISSVNICALILYLSLCQIHIGI